MSNDCRADVIMYIPAEDESHAVAVEVSLGGESFEQINKLLRCISFSITPILEKKPNE